jgi:hypothetical protein
MIKKSEKNLRKVTLSKAGKVLGRTPETEEKIKLFNFRTVASIHTIFFGLSKFFGYSTCTKYFIDLVKKEHERAKKKGFKIDE